MHTMSCMVRRASIGRSSSIDYNLQFQGLPDVSQFAPAHYILLCACSVGGVYPCATVT